VNECLLRQGASGEQNREGCLPRRKASGPRGLRWLGCGFLALLLALASTAPAMAQPLPRLSNLPLEDAAGRPVALPNGPALVLFWASWCPPCRAELLAADRLKGVRLYLVDELVSEVDPAALKEEVRHLGLRHPVLYDTYGAAADALGLRALPTLYRFDARGRLERAWQGYLSREALRRAVSSP
jgi:cytochrome c biogenesis protein CcmG/thiol:disulfide interchange protein DsbE